MKLHVLGSSSSGNGYILQSETTGEVLLVEAGVRLGDVKKALDFDISHIVGCVISHEHGDHCRQLVRYLHSSIDCYTSRGTIEAKGWHTTTCGLHELKALQRMKIGSFEVMSFPVQHDAAEPFGFLIKHEECGVVVFATDTYYLKYRFDGVNNWMIECNYRQDLLDRNVADGLISPARRDRTIKSHMSYETCLETLQANDLSKVNNIVLLHLSSDNSNAAEFVRGIEEATGKNVVAARKGLVMDFNKTPYRCADNKIRPYAPCHWGVRSS